LKKAEFMKDRIGEKFTWTISWAIPAGFFVELDNTVEGLVSVESLEGFYEFDESLLEFKGDGKTYGIWDTVEVVVTGVSLEQSRVSFEIAS
jgi:ribonuclease R